MSLAPEKVQAFLDVVYMLFLFFCMVNFNLYSWMQSQTIFTGNGYQKCILSVSTAVSPEGLKNTSTENWTLASFCNKVSEFHKFFSFYLTEMLLCQIT